MMNTRKNVIWIVIDTLRSDMFASCLSQQAEPNEIDDVLEQGVLFKDVMVTGASTRISSPSYFTSLRPGLTGMANHDIQTLRNLNDDALTVTEYFKHYGYQTMRWDDSSLDSCQPKPGFDVFEAGYPALVYAPGDDYDNALRDNFIKKVRQSKKPVFVNIHLKYAHDFGGNKKRQWSTEEYLKIVDQQAKDFYKLWSKLSPGSDDIVVVTSDHGCTLDQDYADHDKAKPWDFSNPRTQVFASFIAEGLSPSKKHKMIRSMDIAPTLLELAVGQKMCAQGVSLVPVLNGESEFDLVGISERNIGLDKKSVTDYACVRKGSWALFIKNTIPFGLYDYAEGDFVKDYLGDGCEIEEELRQYYTDIVINGPQTPTEFYEKNGLSIDSIRPLPEISILLPVYDWSEEVRLCVDSLLDQVLQVELILLDADSTGKVSKALAERYRDRLILRHIPGKGLSLRDMMNKGLALARGAYTVTATPHCQYAENFCYSLRNGFLEAQNVSLTFPNLKRIIDDTRGTEYVGSDECFDEILFSRVGSGFEHNAYSAAHSLPHFNEIGACAMFETATLRAAGNFVSTTDDCIGETWARLGRLGKVKHVPKGLVISKDPSILRPSMLAKRGGGESVTVLVPLLEQQGPKGVLDLLVMLSAQKIKGLEVLLLHSVGDYGFLQEAATAFPDLQIGIVRHAGATSALLNEGLCSAKGDYLFWADPKDKILPHCLSTLLGYLKENSEAGAVRCGYHLREANHTIRQQKPVCYARDILLEASDLRGLLYRRDLHNEIGLFKVGTENEEFWEMSLQLALITPFHMVEEPLLIASMEFQFSFLPQMHSYQRIISTALKAMGGPVDLVRLYEEVFQYHPAGTAKFILEDDMERMLELLGKTGLECSGSLRVPEIIHTSDVMASPKESPHV